MSCQLDKFRLLINLIFISNISKDKKKRNVFKHNIYFISVSNLRRIRRSYNQYVGY